MKRLLFLQIFILLVVAGAKGQGFSVSGYVADSVARETLIGATVVVEGTNKAAVTDKFGFFSIAGLKKGTYNLSISHLGYIENTVQIEIENKGVILSEILLKASSLSLDEVSVVASRPDKVADKTIETSHIELTPQMIRSIPTAGNDVFAAARYMPGIDRTEPFSPLYTVRGGDPGENAVLLDGVMIYNPYHSSVSSGIFNSMIIKNVDLLVGGFGAEFGGRNSSVMYISSKDGNTSELHGEIEPSTFHSKLFFEFPAGNNASMMVAARYMYDLPFSFIFQNNSYFYDYNLSYTNRLNNRHRITLKYFESKDFVGFNFNTFYKYFGNSFNTNIYDNFILEQRNDWKNRSATAIHKYILSPRVFVRNQVYYSAHQSNNLSGIDFRLEFPDEDNAGDTIRFKWTTNNRLKSQISDLCAKSAVTIKIANFNELHLGVEYNTYGFSNGIRINDVDNGHFTKKPSMVAAFAEDKFSVGFFTIRPGMRFSNYQDMGWKLEPRVNATARLSGSFKLKAAYGEYLQYIISMNSNELEMSQIVDYYYPLDNVKPAKSVHYILGAEKRLTQTLVISADIYYKEMPVVYAFDMNNYYGFSNKLQAGTGNAYGFEIFLEGKHKNLSGWCSYSYAKSSRQYPQTLINEGREFAFDYNRPHTFKTVAIMQMRQSFSLSGSFIFLSGAKRSVETTTQGYYYYDPLTNETVNFPLWTATDKNGARMPPIVNLDMAITKKLNRGFGKQLADLIHADASFATITIRNLLFLYRNVEMYFPGTGIPGYNDKYIPIAGNYLPSVGASYTIKF
ncbi:MAG: TonB-dependent receptor [Bacteroidales bacterium]|nr:TonB-dependent receptor [Bacteroidales bacterium]